ncbi:unnamed protein product [Rotaria magnacalcarata]|uniref:Uncharacterized protein n=1 Tax=Rotaria magnacalcarata TaxID=392030 RepID=A0A814XTR0_9BILA|nr:unnamed protein product [Rotaria magnacalcarata]CAF1220298.1 unnamed protein product [Rotaria magnacalcarata]CAF1917796.1 unnamed protein product [Rotaria magnacalcarata]CAF2073283.1 unnamed protein product [Rotaria magnacalcarata]CAF2107186.1 unnamed protein product [Rotaria magnacalcarata]
MVAIERVGYVYPSVHLQEMLSLAQKPTALATPTQYNSSAYNGSVASVMNGSSTQKITPEQFGLANNPSLQFSTPGGGFVQVFGPLKTPGNDKFFHDPNPVVIQKQSKPVTYVQKINLAYYKPPAPPAPGPVIIKEVRPPQAPAPPPLYVRIQPPPPQEQAPLVIREAPPPRPKQIPTTHLTRMLPPIPVPPPNVQVRNAPNQAALEQTLNNMGLTSMLQ